MAEVRLKAGVQPKLLAIVVAVCNEAQRLGVDLAPADRHVTITAGLDGAHAEDSGHYQLRALDVRSKPSWRELAPEERPAADCYVPVEEAPPGPEPAPETLAEKVDRVPTLARRRSLDRFELSVDG